MTSHTEETDNAQPGSDGTSEEPVQEPQAPAAEENSAESGTQDTSEETPAAGSGHESSEKPAKEKKARSPRAPRKKKASGKKAEEQAAPAGAEQPAEIPPPPDENLPPEEFAKRQEERKADLMRRFEVCKQDVTVMRQKLNDITKDREGMFSEKDGVSNEIGSMIRQIRELKRERDEFTKQVRLKKDERGKLNKVVRDKIQEVKEKRDTQLALMKTHGIDDTKRDPEALLKQIERLDFRIETEAMPFQQEKKVMETIKQLRKEFDEVKVVAGVMTDVRVLSKDINTLKRQSDSVHHEIQDLAAKSQGKHEEMLKISAQIDALKENEKGVFDQFNEFKKLYNEQNAKLKAKLDEMNHIKHELSEIDSSLRQQKQEEMEQEMAVKQEEVEDKIKRGKKLTTADLLIFQKATKDEE